MLGCTASIHYRAYIELNTSQGFRNCSRVKVAHDDQMALSFNTKSITEVRRLSTLS